MCNEAVQPRGKEPVIHALSKTKPNLRSPIQLDLTFSRNQPKWGKSYGMQIWAKSTTASETRPSEKPCTSTEGGRSSCSTYVKGSALELRRPSAAPKKNQGRREPRFATRCISYIPFQTPRYLVRFNHSSRVQHSITSTAFFKNLAWFTCNCCTESYTPPPVDLTPIPHFGQHVIYQTLK